VMEIPAPEERFVPHPSDADRSFSLAQTARLLSSELCRQVDPGAVPGKEEGGVNSRSPLAENQRHNSKRQETARRRACAARKEDA
jgi:hypothetical protein